MKAALAAILVCAMAGSAAAQMAGGPNTGYKREVFTLCTRLAKEAKWSELVPFMTSRSMRFEVVDEAGWEARLTELINSAD